MSKFHESIGYEIICEWMQKKGNKPFDFQEKTWAKYSRGYSGMVIAPTGYGKTYSVFLSVIIDFLNNPKSYKRGLKFIWVSPLRALAKDLQRAMQEAIDEIGLDWVVETRNGDTPQKVRQRQTRSMPDILIVTPETLQLLLAMKNNQRFFKNLHCIAVDEWHELLGSKRGVLTELNIAYIKHLQPKLKIWGITATIGNLDEALEVLIPYENCKKTVIKTKLKKNITIETLLPDDVEVLPWAGHLGKQMVDKLIPVIQNSNTALIFTNTRSQSEMWYQFILEAAPELAGLIAIHHSSIDLALRNWIEESLSAGKLKAAVATSSLDLGVDFKSVDTVIQIGSVKGIARFLQRAGRSGHSPFETSTIYFVPTHSLEVIEISAIKKAYKEQTVEPREPLAMCFDLLIQFIVSIATGDGFLPDELKQIIKTTYAYQWLNNDEWKWALNFITKGGYALQNYKEFHKVVIQEDGLYKVTSRRIAMLHRMNMGVIVSNVMVKVKFLKGGYVGMVEEYFITKLNKGDKFILAGRVLEFVQIKDLVVYVRLSKGKAVAASWLGGRLPLSSDVGHYIRQQLSASVTATTKQKELQFLHPLLNNQKERSHIPKEDEFLVEMIETKDGHHLFMYPFEGRAVNEIFASIVAYRISQIQPMTFTIAMNDYGFELLSDQPIPIDKNNLKQLISTENLMDDAVASVNASEMASRKFRDIAVIAGLVMQNYYGKTKNFKSLQSSSGLMFRVLEEYEPTNLLYKQAYTEVFNQQFQEPRLRAAFNRINQCELIFKEAKGFTPLSFPIKVDSLRGSMSNEDLSKRIARMQQMSK